MTQKFIASTLLAASLGLGGCDSADVAIGVGLIAIGAGAVIIGANQDGSYECRSGYRTECTEYRDRRGYWRRECREVYDSCIDREWRPHSTTEPLAALAFHNTTLNLNNQFQAAAGPLSINKPIEVTEAFESQWASEFGLSFESTARFLTGMKEAREGRIESLRALGFRDFDLRRVAQLKMPTDETIDRVALELNAHPEAVKKMIERLMAEATVLKQGA